MGKNICNICGEKENIQINRNDFFLRIDSSNKKLIEYYVNDRVSSFSPSRFLDFPNPTLDLQK